MSEQLQDRLPTSSRRVELPASEREKLTVDWFGKAADPGCGVCRPCALEQVVLLNLNIALSIAWRYRNRGIVLEDLEQTACMALVVAAQRFDPLQGRDFLSFAVPTITGEVKKHFRDFGWMVRPPRSIQELQPRVEKEHERFDGSEQPGALVETIAKRLSAPAESVSEAIRARGCFAVMSLDIPGGDGASALGDLIVSPSETAESAVEARVMLGPVLRDLREQDRRILHWRFVDGLTQREIAHLLGVTQSQVSRLLMRILGQLRVALTEDNHCPRHVA